MDVPRVWIGIASVLVGGGIACVSMPGDAKAAENSKSVRLQKIRMVPKSKPLHKESLNPAATPPILENLPRQLDKSAAPAIEPSVMSVMLPQRKPHSETASQLAEAALSSSPANAPVAFSSSDVARNWLASGKCQIAGAEVIKVEPISEGACGIDDPVRLSGVTSSSGHPVRIMNMATNDRGAEISCAFAGTLSTWISEDVARLAEQDLGSPLKAVETGPGYSCRRRNQKSTGKISQHSFGKAIDIPVFVTEDGRKVAVASDWGQATAEGRFLKDVRDAACKRFTTVLGPEADSYHKKHFHLDTGCHGASCTYLICE